MGRIVLAVYRPGPGKAERLMQIVARHEDILRRENLITARAVCLMRAADGTIVEMFEWTSAAAIEHAHQNLAVQSLWREFSEVCTYATLDSLAESRAPFADFEAIDN
jgi:quinol monooxygenase YgiN